MRVAGAVQIGAGRTGAVPFLRLGRVQDVVVLFAFTLLSRVVSWAVTTFDVDEWAFAAAAQEVRRGHLPYVTLFDIKALVTQLGGTSAVTLHAFGAVCVFATSALLYRTVLGWTGSRAEALAAGLLYASSSVLFSGLATMTEIMLAPFTCAGVLLLTRYARAECPKLLLACAAGLAFGKNDDLVPLLVLAPRRAGRSR